MSYASLFTPHRITSFARTSTLGGIVPHRVPIVTGDDRVRIPYRIARVRYLKDIESLLLRVADPPGNAVAGKFHRDADVTKVLRKIQRQQTRTLNRIRKVLH
jgi:hypothetical protein